MKKNVSIIGLGYIGLPMACVVAKNAHEKYNVKGFDINTKVVSSLSEGRAHFYEPNLDAALSVAIKNGIEFSTNLDKSDIYVICVPTPFLEDGAYTPDLSYVYSALDRIVGLGAHSCAIIIESTCPVGTTQAAIDYVQNKFGADFQGEILGAYCPERGIPGNTLFEMEFNPRLIGGHGERSKEFVKEFYGLFIKGPLHVTDSKVAEMSKLTENSFRDVNIAFANEISLLAKCYKIDPLEVIKFANLHPRVNILSPGIGVGGHCIPVDPWFLISDNPGAMLLKAARQIDEDTRNLHFNMIVERVKRELSHSAQVNVLMWGLAFKPNVDDIRESPAVDIAHRVVDYFSHNGRVQITCIEPHYNHIKEDGHVSSSLAITSTIPDESTILNSLNVELVTHDLFKFLVSLSVNYKLKGYDACYMGVKHD